MPSTPPTSTPSRNPLRPRSAQGSAAVPTEQSNSAVNTFSKFFTQLKNLIAEAANIEPTSDVAPGIDHCCENSRCHLGLPVHHDSKLLSNCAPSKSASSSSNSVNQVCSRLIVYRDCDRRGRKILFDSEHVSADYVYLKPTDPKLLKELGEYVFGCVPLATAPDAAVDYAPRGHKRFCKWHLEEQSKTLYIWSKTFELGSHGRSKPQDNSYTTTSDQSASPSDQSSGYETGDGFSSSAKTFSLPLFNQRQFTSSSNTDSAFSQTRSLPGHINSYKTNLALVWIFTQEPTKDSCSTSCDRSESSKIPFPYLSPLVEKLIMNPLEYVTQNFYHNGNHFVTSLKNVSTSLNHDLNDFLRNPHVVNLPLIKPPLTDMVNTKLVTKFLELVFTNVDSCVVLNLKKWTDVRAVLYFLKMYLRTCICACGSLDLSKELASSAVETGTDVVSTKDLCCEDSGIGLEKSNTKTTSVSSIHQRKWSIVSEESELGSSLEESYAGRVSFHLGDADVDQSEAKLALGEVDLRRLRSDRRPSTESASSTEIPDIQCFQSSTNRRPLDVKISLDDTKLRDSCQAKYVPCYHCNGTYITECNRFNPFYYVQIIAKPGQVTYDYEYVAFMKIIELYGTGSTRCFNLENNNRSGSVAQEEEFGTDFVKKIKEFVEDYVALSKVTNDSGKLHNFAIFRMEQLRDEYLHLTE